MQPFSPEVSVDVKEQKDKLPTMYWLPKLHTINVKKIAFGNKEHTTDKKIGVSFYWDSS